MRHHGRAGVRLSHLKPARPQRVEQLRARQVGRAFAGALQRLGPERAEQRRHCGALPEPGCFGGNHPAGVFFQPRGRFDFDVQRMAVVQAEPRNRFQRRHRLTGECAAVPGAGVQARQVPPIALARDARSGRGALERRVVQQERHAVGAELHVAFEGSVAVRCADAKSRQRVLGRQFAGAAMGNPQRVGPGRHVRSRCAAGWPGRTSADAPAWRAATPWCPPPAERACRRCAP